MNLDFATHFTNSNPNYKQKWDEFRLEQSRPLLACPTPIELIPYSNTKTFIELTDAEQKELYKNFVIFNAEAQIVLEQMFLFAFRIKRKTMAFDVRAASLKFSYEECLHSAAYRHYLRNDPGLDWPNSKLFLGSYVKFCRRFIAALIRWAPLSPVLPGAKFETYSLHLARYLIKQYGGPETNSWAKVNYLHMKDEAQHVNFDYHYFRDELEQQSFFSRTKTYFATFLVIVILQFLLFGIANKVLKRSIPRWSKWQRLRGIINWGHWALTLFPPYAETKKTLKRTYTQSPFPGSKLFAFMYW